MNFNPFIDLISTIIGLYNFTVIIWLIMFWLLRFDIINIHNKFVYELYKTLNNIIEPCLKLIRNIIPNMGGLDLSPIILFMLLKFINNVLYTYFYVV
jgi:YggT family protein